MPVALLSLPRMHGRAEPRARALTPFRLDLSSAERMDLAELLLIAQQAVLESANYLSARNPGSPTIDELNRVASRAVALRERVKGN